MRLPTFMAISLVIHLVLAAILFMPRWSSLSLSAGASGGASGTVEVVEIRVTGVEGAGEEIPPHPQKSPLSPPLLKGGRGDFVSEAEGDGKGSSRNPNSPYSVFSEIRARIQRAKRYPIIAERQGITGSAEVKFELSENGDVASASLTKSSGSELLDKAALDTIHNAAPYPNYSGPISVLLDFKIE